MSFLSTLPALVTQTESATGIVSFLAPLRNLFTPTGIKALLRSLLVLATGIPLTFVLSRWIRHWIGHRYSAQQGMITGKVVFYAATLIIVITVLMELGFSLTPLLGAAGVLGIALGFAAQTSVSNIISGFFLMAEGPFVLGDLIQVGETTGRVLSIDMLSVKLRTFDNSFVRIPNENLVKTDFINLTRFPIRRADIDVGVAYKEDVRHVREVLFQVAQDHPGALMEPEPQFYFLGYGASSLDFRFGVWVRTERFFDVRNELKEEIKNRFDEAGIEIPFPHRTLYTGAVTEPFPIKIVPAEPPLRDAPASGEDPQETPPQKSGSPGASGRK